MASESETPPQLEINPVDKIDAILETAKEVFKPTHDEIIKYHNKEVWINKVKNGGLLLTISNSDRVVAFAICDKRVNCLHIWNVGVLPEYRKTGYWKKMHDQIIKYANTQGLNKLTLNTYKEKFPGMYNFVSTNGYSLISEEFDETQKLTKSSFEKYL